MDKIHDLLQAYCLYANENGKHAIEGDSNLGNKAYYKLIDVLRNLLEIGDEGINSILQLLDHENPSVRLWAATHALKFNESKATQALEDLVRNDDFFGYDAETVLDEWKAGNLIPIPD